jgi:hypothetical protein
MNFLKLNQPTFLLIHSFIQFFLILSHTRTSVFAFRFRRTHRAKRRKILDLILKNDFLRDDAEMGMESGECVHTNH